jgi:8-oxo-dGTP pyrophosphatase MutT (NUDIX family)
MQNNPPIFDVFQQGLRRGSERLPYDPSKAYAYVEHPTEGWRVYLRSCVFLHPTDKPFDIKNFLVVKRRGARWTSATWEPPKGQMEGKDMKGNKNMMELLRENVLRETEEESHVTKIENLHHTGLVFQSQESDFPPNSYFQYHIFQGFITPEQVQQSFNTFKWIKEHPKAFARWRRDRREKDAVAWFNPKETRLNPRWCPDIAVLYFKGIKTEIHRNIL